MALGIHAGQRPTPLDPTTILASQPKGPNGNAILPNGVAPNVLPLTSNGTMRLPVVDAWNFTIERQLTSSTVFSIGYVGNKGDHVTPGGTNYNVNQPSIVGFGTLSTNQRRYFYQLYGWTQSIKYFSDDGSVKFNSLQVRGEKRFTTGLQLQGNFTWDSAFDFSNTTSSGTRRSTMGARTTSGSSSSTSTAFTSCLSARTSAS